MTMKIVVHLTCSSIILLHLFFVGACFASGGSISGGVTRESDGSPLEGIDIQVFDGNWHQVATTRTDSKGSYRAKDLTAGSYYLRTSNDLGYANKFYPDEIAKLKAAPVVVAEGSDTPGIGFVLFALGSISGRVTADPDGAALNGVQVRVYNKAWTWLYNKYSDESGNFIVDGLKPGVYYLATLNDMGYLDECYDDIQVAGSSWPPEGARAVAVEQGSRVTDVNFIMDPGGTVSGRVTRSSDGAPLNNVAVSVLTEDQTTLSGALSNGDGRYVIQGLPAGRFYLKTANNQGYVDVRFRDATDEKDATPIEIKKGASTDVNFSMARGGAISGRITGGPGGRALEHVEIRVYDAQWDMVKNGISDAGGNFSIGGLPTGAYYLRTSSPDDFIDECYDNVTTSSEASIIQVAQGVDTTGVDFSLVLGGSISGRVTAGAAGRGLDEVYVNVHDPAGKHAGGAPTDLSGLYTVRKIPPGSYHVRTSNAQGYANRYYDNVTGKADATTLTVAPGVTARGIDFMLTD